MAKVDSRKQDELNILFDCINAECASRSLKEKRKALSSPERLEKVIKVVHYGPVSGFRSGKWWGIRMDCSRDYIHEPFNEDIHDGPFGAVSICTSHLNTHNDVDLGDILTFTSQKYSKLDQSKDSLISSYKNRVPIRLVRSYCLSNSYAPKTGYRYDGLYTVIDYWIGISPDSTKYNKFVLVRVLDQERPSWIEKVSSKISKIRKSITPRLTRSNINININQEPKTTKFIYNNVQKESKDNSVSAIVSRQVFKKFIPDSPDSSPKSASSTDSAGQITCPSACPTKLCNTNLSIRTNLYDSSHKLQEVKKGTSMMFSKKSNQSTQTLQKNLHIETEKIITEIPEIEITEKINIIDNSINDKYMDKRMKKVTWADSYNSISNSIEKSVQITGKGFKYSGSSVVDGFSPTSSKKCILKCNSIKDNLPLKNSKPNNNLLSPSINNHQQIIQVHSRSSAPQTSKASFSTMCEAFHGTDRFNDDSSSIDTLAPDQLVNAIVKEKYHPMAKLLIGNMIGLENQESAIISAYNTLTSKGDEDDSIKSKKNKSLNKFCILNKSKKNSVIKKQRREITNLIIDAKFNPISRGLRSRRLRALEKRIPKSELSQRKLLNAQRIQAHNTIVNKEMNTVRGLEPKKTEKSKAESNIPIHKQQKMISTSTQCTLLTAPSVDQSLQIGDSCIETSRSESDMKVELVDLDDIKSEPCDVESSSEEIPSESVMSQAPNNYFSRSAFAAVNTINSCIRITRLKSIGFRPIGIYSPLEDEDWTDDITRPDINEEYNKYTSEENNIVGYMDEQLHFEDIEEEEAMDTAQEQVNLDKTYTKQLITESKLQAIETLLERDFDKPWHGWKKVSNNGQIYWTGY